jgi:4-amino-4-deoxy-L-arabinose transferase-like glycosyltransferase/Flp pilus assembly protein TadD
LIRACAVWGSLLNSRKSGKGPSRAAARPAQVDSSRSGESVARASSANAWDRNFHFGLIAVAVVAAAVRCVYLYQLHGTPFFSTLILDGRAYDAWAQTIVGGDWLGTEVFYQAPLYPYLLSLIYGAAGHSPMAVRVVQSLLGVCACLLLAWTGRRLFDSRVGLIAGVLLALYPPAIFFDGIVQKASVDLALITLLLALVVEFSLRRSWPWLLGLGLTLGSLTLNRENAGLLLPVLLGWIWLAFRPESPGRRLMYLATLTAATALPLATVGLRNYYVGGEFLLTTSQFGPNFYIGNHTGASGRYDPIEADRGDPRFERADATRLAEADLGRKLSPSQVSRYWLARSWADISGQPGAWLRLCGWKTLLVLNAQELVDSEGIDAYADFSWLLRGLYYLLGFGVVTPLAVLGVWATRRDWRKLAVLYAMFLCLAASTVMFYVLARYRFTLTPIVILFAACGLRAIPQMFAAARTGAFWREWGVGCLLAALAAIVCNYRIPDSRDRAITYMNVGMGLLNDQRPADAISPLQKAIEIKPTLAGAYHNLGQAFTALDREQEAVAQYELALRYSPNFGISHARLGQYYSDKRPELAVEHLRSAVQALPANVLLRLELAELLDRQKDVAGCLAEFRAALRVDPACWQCANNLAWILATDADANNRNGAEAVTVAEGLIEREFPPGAEHTEPLREAALLDTLAAAYAEAGRFTEATTTINRAIELAAQQNADKVFQAGLIQRSNLYAAQQPYRRA